MRKIRERDQNLISSEGQDTLACRISGYFSHAFSRKYPETVKLTYFMKSKYCQNEENQQILTKNLNQFWRWSGYISMPNFRLYLPFVLRKCQETPNLTCFAIISQNTAKMSKIKRPRLKFNHFWKWSVYTGMPNFRLFLPCLLQKMLRYPKFSMKVMFQWSQNTSKMRKIKRPWPK